jgi:hypothetical protein
MLRGTIGTEAMIEEVYKGIRPAQVIQLSRSFKPTIWKLLNVERR